MYIPPAFAETDLTKLHDFIEQHSFGLLVSQVDGLQFASYLPFLLERTAGPHGTLVGHMARGALTSRGGQRFDWNPRHRVLRVMLAMSLWHAPIPWVHVHDLEGRPPEEAGQCNP